MKKVSLEKNIVIVLFVLVLVTFSFAHRDSQKLSQLYTDVIEAGKTILAKADPEKNSITLPLGN